jgi:hypothetical protein
LEVAMNAFVEHHQDNIRFRYRCFDRLLLHGAIQPFQQPERILGFFWTYRHLYPVSRAVLRDIVASTTTGSPANLSNGACRSSKHPRRRNATCS